MERNGIATTLKVIGGLIFAGGIILALSADFDEDFTIGTVLVSSFISCMVFMGLGEIIDLLQKNADTQSQILVCLKSEPTLPNHKGDKVGRYRCGNCGYQGPYEGKCPNCNSGIRRYDFDEE